MIKMHSPRPFASKPIRDLVICASCGRPIEKAWIERGKCPFCLQPAQKAGR